jgi:hypothetical protein
MNDTAARALKKRKHLFLSLALGVGLVYYACNPNFLYYDIIGGPGISLSERLGLAQLPNAWIHTSDYTFRLASAFLHGRLGIDEKPPGWLNEFIPLNGSYYSAFPLGSVLSVLPLSFLKDACVLESYPAGVTAALIAAAITLLLLAISSEYPVSEGKKILLALFVVLGTFTWCNLATAGAWQLALGFAVIGELGAIYFSVARPRPLVAGFFFALAFGNRTEVLLLAPLFVRLLCRGKNSRAASWVALRFCAIPFALGVLTLAYNHARFGFISEFGYAKIPGVLNEPWYSHGLFSIYAIPMNSREMLTVTWRTLKTWPYLVPTGFGGSIFLNSPLLLLAFRKGARNFELKLMCWIALGVLTLLLWIHGNPGGWQFSYRYAMMLLPWLFVLLLETSRAALTWLEITLFVVSVAINAYATYLFLWTDYVQP